ncbi:hypothetical protein Salat_2096700 [Sesamum alatum]|uniref:Uncharacterized protein n=1 Tax=Sesamum alatum TaxID=300844 RepID=A0AAE2CGK7_9LAMI|nr:hypothetical protein Salat_2096700 [Sesamum alatum]
MEQIALPSEYECVIPGPSHSVNNPPPGCLTVYASPFTFGLRPPLPNLLVQFFNVLGIPRTQLSPILIRWWGLEGFFFSKERVWEVPVAWGISLNALPPLNLGEIKERMKSVGLLDHGFKATAILKEELLILAGLHPAPDHYNGPLERYTRLRNMMNCVAVRKFIPKDAPSIPSSSGMSVNSSLGAGVFNMLKTINRADVDALSTRTMKGLVNFLPAQTSTTPVIATTIFEKYEHRFEDEEACFKELEAKLQGEINSFKSQVIEGRDEGLASGASMYKSSTEYARDLYHQGLTFYMDGFAVCLEQFKNLGNLLVDFDLSILNVRAGGQGCINDAPGNSSFPLPLFSG